MARIRGVRRVFRLPWRTDRDIRGDIDEELTFHLEMRAAELQRELGLSPHEARRAAERQFGDLQYTRAYCEDNDRRATRTARRTELLAELAQDARYAWRSFGKTPGFTLVAIATLALGIGANTAVFSVVNGVLLRPLPYAEPERLVRVFAHGESGRMPVSPLDLADYRAGNSSFDAMAAIVERRSTLTGDGQDAERIAGAQVSANLFGLIGAQPVIGRWLSPREDAGPAAREVVLSEELWRRRYGGDPAVLGRTLMVDGEPFTVVGVVPRDAGYPVETQLWTPFELPPGLLNPGARVARFVRVLGRLRDGVGIERARAEMSAIAGRVADRHPQQNRGVGAEVVRLRDYMVGGVRAPLLILMGAVGLVMLIACANVANLLLARGTGREGEMAIRGALGASRGRLVRQLATESVLLSLLGGVAALFFALWGTRQLVSLAPREIPRLDEVRVDAMVLLVTLGVALATGLLFGLIPAAQGSRARLTGALFTWGRGAGAAGGRVAGRRVRSALLVSEMALSVTLLAGAGLLMRSFAKLQAVDPGFRPERVVSFGVGLPDGSYATEERRRTFERALRTELAALPGVQAAATTSGLPLSGTSFALPFDVEQRPPAPPGGFLVAQLRAVSPEFFTTIGIPVVRGRLFGAGDRAGAAPVAVINEAAARRFFPAEDPIGKRIRFNYNVFLGGEIVGIVGDVRQFGLDSETHPEVYLSGEQFPSGELTAVMRTASPSSSVLAVARERVRALDPNVPVTDMRTLQSLVDESVSRPRFFTALLGAFALVAVVLASVGLWGVISYTVNRRTHEIGVRMALGATKGRVLRMVMREGITLTVAGAAVGLFGAALATRLMRGLLFGVSPTDPLAFAAGAVILVAVGVLACYFPARRAASVDPLRAIRAE